VADSLLDQRLQALADAHGLSAEALHDVRELLLDLLDGTRDPDERPTVLGATRLDERGPGAPAELPDPTDRFEFRATLGSGGMGEVWRVWDRGLRRSMAMKTVHPDRLGADATLARFVVEAQLTSQLRHPAIVPVHELGRLPDGRLYYTMREVRGQTLATACRRLHAASGEGWGRTDDGWTLRKLVGCWRRACEAVAHAHERGVVHRDLKPSNVMLGEFGEVQVIDWGVAKVLGADDDPVETDVGAELQQTLLGDVIGTPAYMPPEQAYGWNDRVDARSDVYALGAILYELLSGRPPYEPTAGRPVLSQVLEGPPPEVGGEPTVPEVLRRVCKQAMARDRAERFPDARALADAVAPFTRAAES